MPCKVYKAKSEFKNKDIEGSLFLTKNCLLVVVYEIDDNWCFAVLPGGSYGIVPYNFIQEEMDNDYTFMQVCLMDCEKKMALAKDNRTEIDRYQQTMVLEALEEIRASIRSGSARNNDASPAASSDSSCSKNLSWAEQQAKWHSQLSPSKPLQTAASKSSSQASKTAEQILTVTPSDSILPNPLDAAVKSAAKLTPTKSAAMQVQSKAAVKQQVQAKSSSIKPTQPHSFVIQVQPKSQITVAPPIAPTLSRQLIEVVHSSTRAPYYHCGLAVKRVLAIIHSQPSGCQSEVVSQLIEQINLELSSDSAIAETWHWKALSHQFSVIDAYKRQRKEGEISSLSADVVSQLTHILSMADPDIVRQWMRHRNFSGPQSLAELHSAETRLPVKLALVRCLAVMCRLDRGIVEALLRGSTLVTDLLTSGTESPDVEVTTESLNLLAAVFSTLIKPSGAVFDALNEKTFAKLLQRLSSSVNKLTVDSVRCAVVAVILTANLVIAEFATPTKEPQNRRPLFRALVEDASTAAKTAFTEAILADFNRAGDPAAILDHSPPHQDSVLKILFDLVSQEATLVALLKPADIHLLLDVIIRELNTACDISASLNCKKLPAQLKLLDSITASSRYKDAYRLEDLCAVLRKTGSLNTMPGPVKMQSQALLKRLVSRKV